MRALTESIIRKGGASAKKSAGAAESAEMSLFMEFSVGPMTAEFSFRMKNQKFANGMVDSADNLSLLMAPIRVSTFS